MYKSIFPFITVEPMYIWTSHCPSFLFTTLLIIKCPTLQIGVSELIHIFVYLHVYIFYVYTHHCTFDNHTTVALTNIPFSTVLQCLSYVLYSFFYLEFMKIKIFFYGLLGCIPSSFILMHRKSDLQVLFSCCLVIRTV